MTKRGLAMVAFKIGGLQYRLEIPMPVRAVNPTVFPRGWGVWGQNERTTWLQRQWEQGCRERWRMVVLLTKAKLEAVKLGLSTVEKEFMPSLVLEDGRTVYQAMGERIHRALSTKQPLMLEMGSP